MIIWTIVLWPLVRILYWRKLSQCQGSHLGKTKAKKHVKLQNLFLQQNSLDNIQIYLKRTEYFVVHYVCSNSWHSISIVLSLVKALEIALHWTINLNIKQSLTTNWKHYLIWWKKLRLKNYTFTFDSRPLSNFIQFNLTATTSFWPI